MEDGKIKNDLLEHSETCGECAKTFPNQSVMFDTIRMLGKEWFGTDFEKELISAYMRGVRKQ